MTPDITISSKRTYIHFEITGIIGDDLTTLNRYIQALIDATPRVAIANEEDKPRGVIIKEH